MTISTIRPRRIAESLVAGYGATTEAELLERRLIEGERRIVHADARGEDTTRLVDFWIELLHQYERSVDSLEQAA